MPVDLIANSAAGRIIQTSLVLLAPSAFILYWLCEWLMPKSLRLRLEHHRTIRRRQKYERESLKQRHGQESYELSMWQQGFRDRWLGRESCYLRSRDTRDPEIHGAYLRARALWSEGWKAADAEQTPKSFLLTPSEDSATS